MKLSSLGSRVPFWQQEVFAREPTNGPDRLRVGGGRDSVAVLAELAHCLPEPVYLLLILEAPRREKSGRYQSAELTYGEAVAFLIKYRSFFIEDARASVWLGSCKGGALVALDEHDILYAYGPLAEFAARLDALGYTDGLPAAPTPHEHYFNAEFDDMESAICAEVLWRSVLPLLDEVDQ